MHFRCCICCAASFWLLVSCCSQGLISFELAQFSPMLPMASGALRRAVASSAMKVMGSWPHLADQQEHCRVTRDAHAPDASTQPDSCHVRRGIRSGPSVAGPITIRMRTLSHDDGDPVQADMVMQLRTQLPRADSDANIDQARTWTVSGASTTDRINHFSEDVLANSVVSGRQSSHDDDDYDGAGDISVVKKSLSFIESAELAVSHQSKTEAKEP